MIGVYRAKVTVFIYSVETQKIAYVVDAYASFGRSDALNGKVIVSYRVVIFIICCMSFQLIIKLLLINCLTILSCVDYCCLYYLDCIIWKIGCHCKSTASSFRLVLILLCLYNTQIWYAIKVSILFFYTFFPYILVNICFLLTAMCEKLFTFEGEIGGGRCTSF
jgi:hypothetical protein